jgi:hypothetical protein
MPWLVLKGGGEGGAWVELCIRGVRTRVKLLITIQHNNHQIKHEGRSHHQHWVKHRDVENKQGEGAIPQGMEPGDYKETSSLLG